MLVTEKMVSSIIEKVQNAPSIGYDSEWGGGADSVSGKKKSSISINPDLRMLGGFSISVGPKIDQSWYVPVAHFGKAGTNLRLADCHRLLRATLDHPRCWAWNWKEDWKTLLPLRLRPRNPLDGMVATYLLWGPSRLKLKEQVLDVFKKKPQELEEVTGGRSVCNVAPEEIDSYASADAWNALRMGELRWSELAAADMLDVFALETDLIEVLLRHEDLGVAVSHRGLEALAFEAELLEEEALGRWRQLQPNLSPYSVQQLHALYEEGYWNPDWVEETPKGAPKVDADALAAQLANLPEDSDGARMARVLRDLRDARKLRTTYAVPLLRHALSRWDGRVHPKFNQTVARSMRLSSSKPNFQNFMKRGTLAAKLLRCLVATPGYVVMFADFSQVELGCAAELCGGYLKEARLAGKDLHQATADAAGVPRHIGKNLNFAILFGSGAKRLSRMAQMPINEAKALLRDFKRKSPEIEVWKKINVSNCAELGFTYTLLGHRRPVNKGLLRLSEKKLKYGDPKVMRKWAEERICNNTPIQGLAAGIQKRAAVRLLKEGPPRFLGQIHDSCVFEVPEDKVGLWANRVRKIMESAGAPEVKLPLPVDIEVGPNWASLKEVPR